MDIAYDLVPRLDQTYHQERNRDTIRPMIRPMNRPMIRPTNPPPALVWFYRVADHFLRRHLRQLRQLRHQRSDTYGVVRRYGVDADPAFHYVFVGAVFFGLWLGHPLCEDSFGASLRLHCIGHIHYLPRGADHCCHVLECLHCNGHSCCHLRRLVAVVGLLSWVVQ